MSVQHGPEHADTATLCINSEEGTAGHRHGRRELRLVYSSQYALTSALLRMTKSYTQVLTIERVTIPRSIDIEFVRYDVYASVSVTL